MPVMGYSKFERFFRAAGGVDVDRNDMKRFLDFVNEAIYDLLLAGQATAEANGRDVIQPSDLPITAGLQETMHVFRKLDEDIELRPILDALTARPPLGSALSEQTEERLPMVFGGISVALAKTLKILDPRQRRVPPGEWHRAFRILDTLI
jgi:Domain of unknown function (DUF1931)